METFTDNRWMEIALAEAAKGRGSVEPNPMVGAVLVRQGVELARGHHRALGGPHAEVEALAAARAAGADLRGATLYVTLEPCCHRNKKTPPCTDALLPLGLAHVVVAMDDPDENVRGRGIALLRAAGIRVDVGAGQQPARKLLRAYVQLRTQGRPWVIGKWAATAEGYLALPPGHAAGRWISCEQSRAHAHRMRGLCDGIAVGAGTAAADDPTLNNRSPGGKQPCRVVLDGSLRIALDSRLVQTARQWPLLIATTTDALANPASADKIARLRAAGAELLAIGAVPRAGATLKRSEAKLGGALPGNTLSEIDLPALLTELGRRRWTYLLVEGGRRVLESFIRLRLLDELQVYTAPITLGQPSGDLPRLDLGRIVEQLHMELEERAELGADCFTRYVRG